MSTPKVLAVDPGVNGGLAWIDPDGFPKCEPMPKTKGETIDFLRALRVAGVQKVAMEQVVAFIPDASPAAMFKFGGSFEFLQGVIMTLGFQLIMVHPKKWQKGLSLGQSERKPLPCHAKGISKMAIEMWKKDHADEIKAIKSHNSKAKRDWKHRLFEVAQQRFPTCDVTLKTADALLIMAWAMGQPDFQ